MATPLTDSINALTTYANEVTGASDTTLSDAVYTLAQGFGGGAEVATGTFTGNGTNTVDITCDFEPDIIMIKGDLTQDVSLVGTQSITIIRDFIAVEIYDDSTSTTTKRIYANLSPTGLNNSSYGVREPYAIYASGILSVYINHSQSVVYFPNSITYSYTLIKYIE